MSEKKLLEKLNAMLHNTMMEALEMRFTEVDEEVGIVKMEMPVQSKVHQPYGLLHGGASAALAESVGSASSLLYADPEKFAVVGIELACNHLRGKREGKVTAVAKIIHKGKRTHHWQIDIQDEDEKLISRCKLTNMVIPHSDMKK